jgi:ATP-dependent protease ClpP protease subunit
MKRIYLSGYIGYDLTSTMVKQWLDEANGEEVEIHLNTQGGIVTEGIAIYDLIDKYTGKKSCLMGGLVASIGSYIATACQKVTAQDITVYMVHNAANWCFGDYHDMQNEAESLEKLNKHIADRLSRFSKKGIDEVLNLMDEETWYYGKEIVDAGFATDFLETGKASDQASNVLDIEKYKYHERLKSVAAYFGNPPEKPKEEAMKFEDFLTAAKDFVKSGEFKLESALDLFGAKDKLITDKQKAALDALGEDDPKALKDQLAEAKKKAVNAELDEAFGKDGNLRMYADEQIEKGKTVDEIRKMPIAVALAAERAAGIDQIVEQKPKDEQTTVGDKIIASY